MFLKSLVIENSNSLIRHIPFHKGINLIVDETLSSERQTSGNNVGKTTVLRLIDFCLGGKGENIYMDPEFRSKSNSTIESYLKENNITITLSLVSNLDDEDEEPLVIRKNFLSRTEKIQEINGEQITNDNEFRKELGNIIFKIYASKPTFRQIISKNIRDEKNRLQNTVKVLHQTTQQSEYEALYLFWFGVSTNTADRKNKLLAQIKIEKNLQKRLKKDSTLGQINQSLLVVNRSITELENSKANFNLDKDYENKVNELSSIKIKINSISSTLSRLDMRESLIIESKNDLEQELATIDTNQIKRLYKEAKALLPDIQRTFEETLSFHNKMIQEKIKYIGNELPTLKLGIFTHKGNLSSLLSEEEKLTEELKKSGAMEELESILVEINLAYETKGSYEDRKSLWKQSNEKLDKAEKELEEINDGISSLDDNLQKNIAEFNKYFTKLSEDLYDEQFVLSADKNDNGYELNIGTISGNLGTGKKKGQMAAFDLAYVQFADENDINCLHFILHDQIENVHDNQISNLLTKIVGGINCQYVLPVLRDKLPDTIDVSSYVILTLSQEDKLFKVP